MLRNVLLVLIYGLLLSCNDDQGQPMDPIQISKYFLLKDFVESQVKQLEGAKVRKFSHIKGNEENSVQEFNEEGWRRELDIFIQADINKSSLASSYETEKSGDVLIHRLKPGEKSLIQEIKVIYEGEQVSQINFISHQDNLFYTSGSTGELAVDPSSGIITTYEVKGTQKVWFLPPNEMEVRGEVLP